MNKKPDLTYLWHFVEQNNLTLSFAFIVMSLETIMKYKLMSKTQAKSIINGCYGQPVTVH